MLEIGKHLGYQLIFESSHQASDPSLLPRWDQIYVLDVGWWAADEYQSWAPYFSCHKCNFHIQKSSHLYVNVTKKDRKNSDVLILQSHFWDFTALNDLSVSWTDSTRVAWAPGGACACSPVMAVAGESPDSAYSRAAGPRFPPACRRLASCGWSVSVPGWWRWWCCWPRPVTSSDVNPSEHLWHRMHRRVQHCPNYNTHCPSNTHTHDWARCEIQWVRS